MHAILERFRFVRLREKNILLIMLGILAIIAAKSNARPVDWSTLKSSDPALIIRVAALLR